MQRQRPVRRYARRWFSGELVYVGPGGEDDYDGVDAKGKVILTELSLCAATLREDAPGHGSWRHCHGHYELGSETSTSVPYGTSKSVWKSHAGGRALYV